MNVMNGKSYMLPFNNSVEVPHHRIGDYMESNKKKQHLPILPPSVYLLTSSPPYDSLLLSLPSFLPYAFLGFSLSLIYIVFT